jgi:hypothetical protein
VSWLTYITAFCRAPGHQCSTRLGGPKLGGAAPAACGDASQHGPGERSPGLVVIEFKDREHAVGVVYVLQEVAERYGYDLSTNAWLPGVWHRRRGDCQRPACVLGLIA